MAPLSFLNLHLHRWAVLGLLFVLAAFAVLPEIAGLHREDLQFLLFPVVVLLIWQLPKQSRAKLPALLAGAALFFWLLSSLHLRGFFHFKAFPQKVYMAQLEGDEDDAYIDDLYRGYSIVSRTYSTPEAGMLQRRFGSTADAAGWLTNQSNGLMVISGSRKWLDVLFRSNPVSYFHENASTYAAAKKLQREARQFGLDLRKESFAVRVPGTDVDLALGMSPEMLRIGGRPIGLVQHLLAWLARGLSVDPIEVNDRRSEGGREQLALRRDAFFEATLLEGAWTSPGPLGLAYFFLGLTDMLEALDDRSLIPTALDCAQKNFRRGVAKAIIREEPAIAALIFNNAAVGSMLLHAGGRDYYATRHWLERATFSYDGSGKPTLGARLAMFNLRSLERAGLIVD